jgi:TolB-like protein/DNA-binding winged helix-turn-helix (wHTH) protein/Tfp pilus assembly protein PilF
MDAKTAARHVYRFGVFELDAEAGELRKAGARLRVQEQPLRVLRALVEGGGRVVSRDELRQQLWPADTFVDFDHGLNEAIARVRTALGDSADSPRFIETLPRRGYRFVAPVEGLSAAPATEPAPAGRSSRRRRWAVVAAAVLVLGGVAWLLARGGPRATAPPRAPIRSLAVLPLANLSSDQEQEYFADGMTDALIAVLARLDEVKVISRTSVMRYKDTQASLPEIARALQVEGVIEGTVLRSGDRVRITVQLIRAEGDEHLWSGSYERKLEDVLGLQSEVALAVAREIRAEFDPGDRSRLASAPAVASDAYEACLRGRYLCQRRTPEGLQRALVEFHRATEIDPRSAVAFAGLADTHLLLAAYNVVPHGEALAAARTAATRALELDDGAAEPHVSLGWIHFMYDWDWAAAERAFRRGLALSPGYAGGHQWYGIYLTARGRFAEAQREVQAALKLDPLSLAARENLGWIAYCARDLERAEGLLRAALDLDPEYAPAHRYLGLTLLQKGDASQAISELEAARVLLKATDTETLADLARAHALAGRAREAERLLRELTADMPRRYVSRCLLAAYHASTGRTDEAFRWLGEARDEREGHLAFLAVDPAHDPLRSDPRFAVLLAQLGLAGVKPAAPPKARKAS